MTRKGLLSGMLAEYRIQVQGYLDGTWSDRLGDLTIVVNSEPVNGALATTLFGRLRDQTDLIGVLNTLYDLRLPLLSVEYLTQQAALDSMKVLPGYDTRCINIPKAWAGQTLNTLNVNEQFEVNVIGLLDRSEGDEEPKVLFSSTLTRTLDQDDVLVIYGRDKNLDALETAVVGL